MNKSEFEDIPSVLERLKPIWGKINSNKSGIVTLDRSERQEIKEAFIAAANYEDMSERWHQAHRLFIDKDLWPKKNREATHIKNVKKAVDIMQLIQNHKGKKYHPLKNNEMRGYYLQQYVFRDEEEDGSYYDEKGNSYESKGDLRKQIVTDIADKYGFPSPKAASEHLRTYCNLKNLPDFRDHSK
jgi:hypothetical protein